MGIAEQKIIPATEADRKEIFAFYRKQVGREYCPWTMYYPSEETITFDLKRNALFILRDDSGRLIATVSLEEDPAVDALPCWTHEFAPGGELARLAVEPELQNHGIARRMLQFGMDRLKERGFRSVHFLVNKLNKKAIRSYAVFDFQIVGECDLYNQPFFCYEAPLI